MNRVGAALGVYVDQTGKGASVFSRGIAGDDGDFPHRIERRSNRNRGIEVIVVGHAVQQNSDIAGAKSIDGKADSAAAGISIRGIAHRPHQRVRITRKGRQI